MNRFLVLPVLFLLTGCGALASLQQSSKLDTVIEDLKEVREIEVAARKKADVDGDGKLSLSEMAAYLSLLAAAGADFARRKQGKEAVAKHEASKSHRQGLELEIAKLKAQLDAKA